jgi:hypothetical protein
MDERALVFEASAGLQMEFRKGCGSQFTVSTIYLSECVRFVSCLRSFRSLLRPKVCLLAARSSRELKFTGTPKKDGLSKTVAARRGS